MGKYFGTDGFRGEANETLTARHAFRIGHFLSHHLGRDGKKVRVVIGKDTRRSGYMLEAGLISGLTSGGADVWLLHVVTTPCVSYAVRAGGFDCGMMITASHNPFRDNGIKLFNAAGEKMDDSLTDLLEDYLDSKEELPLAKGEQIGRKVDFRVGKSWYLDHLVSCVPVSLKGMKVGLDCANGAAWKIAGEIFHALGAETHIIHAQPDGFNINRNAGSSHMECLRKLVMEQGLDVGFAYDGDGDRCMCVDEQGKIVTGDHILYICGKYMKERGLLPGNRVVTTVMSNYGLWEAFKRQEISCATTAVGDRYVYEYLKDHDCGLGGEQSGHIIFPAHAVTGDGILTSLKVLEVMLAKEKTLNQLCRGIRICPQVLENVSVKNKDAVMADPDVKKTIAEMETGLKGTGRVLVRASGTEPMIRVMAEADEEVRCRACVKGIANAIMRKENG